MPVCSLCLDRLPAVFIGSLVINLHWLGKGGNLVIYSHRKTVISSMSTVTLFEEKHVRRAWNEQEEKWYFAIVDVVAVLTESVDPGAYWRNLKEQL